MKAALISLGSKSSKMQAETMEKYFDQVDMLDIRRMEVSVGKGAQGVLYEGKPIGEYDCVVVKGSFRYAAIQNAIASYFEGKSYMPYSPKAFSIVHDKLLTHLELQKEQIPMPRTYLTPTVEAAKGVLDYVNYPIIIKIPNGTQGKGVMFADSQASAKSVLDTLATLNQPFLIQEFIETEGSDLRVFVVGKKVIATMKRKATGEDKRANLHAGGEAEAVLADNQTKTMAIKTAQLLGAEICGVDILEGPTGPLVIEANLSPGLQGITEITKIDVADKIAQHLHQSTVEFMESKKKPLGEILEETGIEDTENLSNHFMTTLDFRGERVLLPKIVSKGFKEETEYYIEFEKNHLHIRKSVTPSDKN